MVVTCPFRGQREQAVCGLSSLPSDLRPLSRLNWTESSRTLEGVSSLAFTKAHGAGNDFLIVDREKLSGLGLDEHEFPRLAIKICDRQFGVGADGLEVVGPAKACGAIALAHLWNSDGSEAEISGNGTRCVAAYLTRSADAPEQFSIETGAGVREIERTSAEHPFYEFRMTTSQEACRVLESELTLELGGSRHVVTTVDVGNPQCVCRVDSLGFDWRALGAAIERHARFANGTNVSFVKVVLGDGGLPALEVLFWERGAGATLSSGTGSLGAAVAARHSGWVGDRARILTQGGELFVDWDRGIRLTGPAKIIAQGSFEVE